MAKIPARARQSFDELSAFLARQEVVDSLERAAGDKALLRTATKDPKAFLAAEGHKLPRGTDATVRQQRAPVSGRVTVCVEVCVSSGDLTLCSKVCVSKG